MRFFENLITHYETGLFEQSIASQLSGLKDYVLARIARHQAEVEPGKLAVVLDIDETTLSNYQAIKKCHFANKPELLLSRYCEQTAKAIKPMLEFYKFLIANHIEVFFVTFRPESVRSATVNNLNKEGYKVDDCHVLMPTLEEEQTMTPLAFKILQRKKLVEDGYINILVIGDQVSDVEGDYVEHFLLLENRLYSGAIATIPQLSPPHESHNFQSVHSMP